MESARDALTTTVGGSGYIVKTHSKLAYPSRLSFYKDPPIHTITLEDFETWALARLRILTEIESAFARNRSPEEVRAILEVQCAKHMPLDANTATNKDLDEQRRRDYVSHFVLRLAFCRSEELRRQFSRAETALFKYRLELEAPFDREAFLSGHEFSGKQADEEELRQCKKNLEQLIPPGAPSTWVNGPFYKVPWHKVTELVAARRVFLKGGMAFVPTTSRSSIVTQEFTAQLDKALELTSRSIARLEEDDRLEPVLAHLGKGFLAGMAGGYEGDEEFSLGEKITAEMIDDLARKHFPSCMRNLHERLRGDKHLKHFGRLQYNLFLKVLGLPIEEALVFWRRSFANKTDDQFNKEYKYNIRHGYGLEGRRHNYPAKSCQSIITQENISSGEAHGCPFRLFGAENLKSHLSNYYKISNPAELLDISKTVAAGHYHVACTRVFELSHGIAKGEGLGHGETVSHPNRYAARSRELEREKKGVVDMVVD